MYKFGIKICVEEIGVRLTTKAFYLAAALMVLSVSVAASVVINEMELNSPEGGVDWIEIYNPDNESVDISEWTADMPHSTAHPER